MRLASEGLVASQGRSFSVPALGRQDVEDIYGMRNLLEPAAMRQVAARSADAALRAPVEAALAAARAACDDGDAAAFREANQRFRAAWLALVPNPRLVRAIEQYADHMVRIRRLTLGDSETRKRVLQGLERIAAALAAGNADAAEQAVRQHLAAARSAFLAAVGLED